MKEEKIKTIMNTLEHFKFKRDVIQVFCDCVESMALQIAIACDPKIKKKNIERFEHIFDDYDNEDKSIIRQLHKEITDLLAEFQNKHDDYLGELYMQVVREYGKPKLCQFFTPYHISHFMASVVVENQDNTRPYKMADPCCGAGGLCIAFVDVLKNKKINYLQNAIIIANDIDKTCVYMTYLQLSFAGAAAIVKHQDSLTQETWDTFRTLGYYLQQSQNREEMT